MGICVNTFADFDTTHFYRSRCRTVEAHHNSFTIHFCVFCFKGLAQLEREISYLGGMCAASLMRKDIVLPPITAEEMEEDLDLVDEGAQQVCSFIERLFICVKIPR